MKKNFIVPLLILGCVSLFYSCKKEQQKVTIANSKQPQDEFKTVNTKPVSDDEVTVLKMLIDEEKKGNKYSDLNIKESPFSVSILKKEDKYTVSFSVLGLSDMNGDGVVDYVIEKEQAGIDEYAGADSEFYTVNFLIMKDKIKVDKRYSFLSYGRLYDYTITQFPKFSNHKLNMEIKRNPLVEGEDDDDEMSYKLEFIYKNANLYEASYLTKCKLAKLKSKTIFNTISNVVKRTRGISESDFTELIEESYERNDTLIRASLSGCDNLNLSFEISLPVTKEQLEDEDFLKEVNKMLLKFLTKNTQFSQTINQVISFYEEHEIKGDLVQINKKTACSILIDKGQYDKKRGLLSIVIKIVKEDNPNQNDSWDVLTRKK